MKCLLLLASAVLVVGCGTIPDDTDSDAGFPKAVLERDGGYDPEEGLLGYEAYSVVAAGGISGSYELGEAIRKATGTRGEPVVFRSKPDLRIEAKYLGQEEGDGDRYGIWLAEGILARLPEAESSGDEVRIVGYRLDQVSLERIRLEMPPMPNKSS